MGRIKDLTGQRFGRLVVIDKTDKRINNAVIWSCQCDCGNGYEIDGRHLTRKKLPTQSCGCILKTRSGLTRTPEGMAWLSMRKRCYNPKDASYVSYGARGIKVCDRWKDSIDNFVADMGLRPGKGYSLDRINVNGDYTPENCRWATTKEQGKNKRVRVFEDDLIEALLVGFKIGADI